MSDEAQQVLGAFSETEETRPDAEAAHVAGTNGSGETTIVDPRRETLPESHGELDVAVMQVDYTIVGSGDDEQPIVHVFGRTDESTLEHVQIVGFRPYFYAPADSVDEERLASYGRLTGWEESDEDGEPYESIRGEKLVKIFGRTPRDVGQIRDEFDHYEADILFPNRFLIDKGLTSGVEVPLREDDDGGLRVHEAEVRPADVQATPRVNVFDIEVDDR